MLGNKLVKRIIVAVGTLVLLFSFVFVFIYGYSSKEPRTVVLVPVDYEGGDLQAISEKLFEDYLKYHKTFKVDLFNRIRDYEISQVYADGELKGDRYRFSVDYELKIGPRFHQGSDWIPGNGITDGHWLRHKMAIVTVIAEDGYYRIYSMGTGP